MPPIRDLLSYSDKDLVKMINEDFRHSEDYRIHKDEENWMANQMYNCRDIDMSMAAADNIAGAMQMGARAPLWDLTGPMPNKSYLPWLRGVLMTAAARLSNGIWPDYEDFFRLDPTHPDDEDASDQAFEALKYFIRASRYTREGLLTIIQALKYDFAIMASEWSVDFGYVPNKLIEQQSMRNFVDGRDVPIDRIAKMRQSYQWTRGAIQQWKPYAINTFCFRYDPDSDHMDFDNCEWAGPTYPLSKRRMHELVEAEIWPRSVIEGKDAIKGDEPMNDNDDTDRSVDYVKRIEMDSKLGTDDRAEDESGKTHHVRVKEYCTKNAKVYVLNGRLLVRPKTSGDEPGRTIGWPYHKVTFMPDEGHFSGTSMARPLMPIQFDINFMHRLIRDEQDKAVNVDRLVDGSHFESPDEAQAQPWGTGATIVLPKNPLNRDVRESVAFLAHPSNTAGDMWNSMSAEMQAGERATGVSANAQTTGMAGDTSATEVAQVAEGAESRSSYTEKAIEVELVSEVLQRLLKLIHLNVDEEFHVRVKGKKGKNWRKITPSSLLFHSSPDVVPLGMSAMQSRTAGFQALRDSIISISASPIFAQYLKVVPSLRAIFRAIDYDPDDFVNDENIEAATKLAQHLENILMKEGIDVPINSLDNHAKHLEEITQFVMSDAMEAVAEEYRELFQKHAQAHKAAMAQPQGGVGAPSLPGNAAPTQQANVPAAPGVPVPGAPAGPNPSMVPNQQTAVGV